MYYWLKSFGADSSKEEEKVPVEVVLMIPCHVASLIARGRFLSNALRDTRPTSCTFCLRGGGIGVGVSVSCLTRVGWIALV